MRRSPLLLALCLPFAFASPALAGGLADGLDLVQVTPFVGAQIVRPLGQMPTTMSNATWASGLTVGGTAGIRLWPISLGVLVQHTGASSGSLRELGVDRLYGELGLCTQFSRAVLSAHFDAGYAYVSDGNTTTKGFGGKIGMGFEYFPYSILSVGADAAFDLQAFPVEGQPLISVGGTFAARVGLHL